MKGRKPLPASVLERRGAYKSHPGRRKNNPTPPKAKPKMPKHLAGYAKQAWDNLTAQLDEMGILSSADTTAMAVLCDTYNDWRIATEQVARTGQALLQKDKDGKERVMRNPYVVVKNNAADRLLKLLAEFGLTPSSRSRIEVKEADDGDDWFANAMKLRMQG